VTTTKSSHLILLRDENDPNRRRYAQLGSLFAQLGEDAFHGFPVKADLSGAAG